MVPGLAHDASPTEILKFLVITDGFVAFMRTQDIQSRTAKVHSKRSDVFVGQCSVRAATIERMIGDGLLTFVGCESMTVSGILEYFEPTEQAKAKAALPTGA